MATINKTMKTLNVPSGDDTICYEIVDDAAREDMILVQNSQPEADCNKLWINESASTEYQVPTESEFELAITNLDNKTDDIKSAIQNGLLSAGLSLRVSASTTGYKIKDGGVQADETKTLYVYPISDEPIYVKSQDGFQYRSSTSASSAISTVLGSYDGWVDPINGANYVAISFDTVNVSLYGAFNCVYMTDTIEKSVGTLNSTVLEDADVPIPLTIEGGYYTETSHALTFVSDSSRQSSIVSPVSEGDKYKLSTSIRSTAIAGIFFLTDNYVIDEALRGNGTQIDYTDYEITIPLGCNKIVIQCANPSSVSLSLKKESKIAKAYSKAETNALIEKVSGRYGIKWAINDPNDLGSRCFDAVGKTATIGVGSTDGSSDFDAIYPWSEMKRCNIKTTANGAKVITFEGETGFALDGTNGDVFVRIPKFYIERYTKDGYEYRIISADGETVHPAFVENGEVLDEIFVSAFEGYSNGSKLQSIAGVIPTSNIVPADFLDLATANGRGYTLYDMRTSDAIWLLMAVEYGKRNSNRILGYGFADFRQPDSNETMLIREAATSTNSVKVNYSATTAALMPVGSNITICSGTQTNIIAQRKITNVTNDGTYMTFTFDGDPIDVDLTCFCGSAGCTTNFCATVPSGTLAWHTGRANWINNSITRNPVRYRWIENPVGSLWAFFPDVTFSDLQMYVCKNIDDYEMFKHDGTKYIPVGNTYTQNSDNGSKSDVTNANYWITSLSNEYFAKANDFGRTYDKSLISTKAFGAYYYLNTGVVCIANGGGFDHLYRCNMLTNRAWIKSTDKWYLYGARTIYKNII